MVTATRPTDRRRWVRHSTDLKTRFQLTVAGDHLYYPARIRDISRGGVKLVADRRLEPGTVVKVIVLLPVKAQVAHATPLPDGTWALGLAFANELGQAEMITLLERPTITARLFPSPAALALLN